MTVIAMTREMGTLGKDVAAKVSQRLGIEVVHHELVERHLADRLNASESTVHRFLEGEATMWERWQIDRKRLSRYTSEEVLDLAKRGNVLIRGWGAAQLLRDVAHVIRVRVCAPMNLRIDEMKRRLGVESAAAVRREIERNDDAHARTVDRQFQVDWRDPTGYDIVLNTAHVSTDAASAVLQNLAESGQFDVTQQSQRKLEDKLLEVRVMSLLDQHNAQSPIGSGLMVSVADGHVAISGVADHSTKLQSALADIRKLDGVNGVANETVMLRANYGP